MKHKECKNCKELKPVSEFYIDRVKKSIIYRSICKECVNFKKRKRYNDDKNFREKLIISSFKYAHSGKGEIKRREYNRKRVKTQKFKDYHKKWEKNTEKGRASMKRRMKKWLKTENGKFYHLKKNVRRKTRLQKLPCTLTVIEWKNILRQYNNSCAYCGIGFSKETPATKDHIVPITKGGGFIKENIVPACRVCNGKKGNKLWVI